MTHSITLDLPETVYKKLVEKASKSGKRVEDFAVDQLSNGDSGVIDDPFEKFIGSLHTDVSDWADNHDKYIGEQLMREMRGENE